MIKMTTILGLVLMSSTVFANSVTCKINIYRTDKVGFLMPVQQKLDITSELSNSVDAGLDQCSTAKYQNMNLRLCAKTANFIGGFEVGLIRIGKNINDSEVVSARRFGTEKFNNGLIEVYGKDIVLASFLDKTVAAGIEAPVEYIGDSASLDEAVKQGMQKGILAHDEPVLVMIDNCHLNK